MIRILFFLMACLSAQAASVQLLWDANSEPNLLGYKVFFGTVSRTYTASVFVPKAQTTATLTNQLVTGLTNYFAVTAVTDNGLESDYSKEVFTSVRPAPPRNVVISVQVSGTVTGPWKDLASFTNDAYTADAEFYRTVLYIRNEP